MCGFPFLDLSLFISQMDNEASPQDLSVVMLNEMLNKVLLLEMVLKIGTGL